ncbi:unnamed protein product [Orchesella dallaii]|uniref:Uncharacterized protein n=1 Tax=Orchesella dallaii TaxID=48710 RepID=A0ABP1RJ39_9HEXA
MSYRREENYHPMRYQEPPPPPLHYGPAFHPGYRYDHPRESPWDASAPGHYHRPSEHVHAPIPFTNFPPPVYYKGISSDVSQNSHQYYHNYHRNPNQYHQQQHHQLPTTSSNFHNIPNLIPIQGFRPEYSAHHNLFEYQNTQPAHAHSASAPTLRHILTHYQPPNHNQKQRMREEEKSTAEPEGKCSRNPRKPPVSRKKSLKPANSADPSTEEQEIVRRDFSEKAEEKQKKERIPKRSRIVWKKKRQMAPLPTESFSSSDEFEEQNPSQNESPKELDLSLKKRVPKRKSDGNHPEVGKVTPQNSVTTKIMHLLSEDHEDKSWIKKGTVVKSIQHNRPMGTIIGVAKERSICTLQFFSGWKAEIQTKFVTPVVDEADKTDEES